MSFVAILVTITVPQVPHEIAIRETGGCKEMWQMNGLPMSSPLFPLRRVTPNTLPPVAAAAVVQSN